jgi:hypothetical protein
MLIGIVRNSKKEGSLLVQELISVKNVSYYNQAEEISNILTHCIDEEGDNMASLCLNDYYVEDGGLTKVIDNALAAIYGYDVIIGEDDIIEKLNSKEIVSNRYFITDDNQISAYGYARILWKDTHFEVA